MKILVIGSGGREHAIVSKLAESAHQPEIHVAPGNPGMSALAQRLSINPSDLDALLIHAQREQYDLTVVGPEAPLAAGIVDRFREAGLTIFGPSQAAAQLEASKHFAKEIMGYAGVPTAGYEYCKTEADALEALSQFEAPYVIKEDGLAGGKGVTIAKTLEDAKVALHRAFKKGMTVIIEEFMEGQELSVMALCDGSRAIPLLPAQDFKRLGEGDTGPNTGGMGAYAPVPFVSFHLMNQIQERILNPVMFVMKERATPFRGILYAGLMITPQGEPRVVEFNVRFGDPETQVVLPLLKTDLVEMLLAAADGTLADFCNPGLQFTRQSAVTVVLASDGYPGAFETGLPLNIPETIPDTARVFHAGTGLTPARQLVTQGGRVLNVTGLGSTLEEARTHAYAVANQIAFKNKIFRPDIAAQVSAALA